MGGPICLAKGFWLYYTIITWFFVLPFALFMLPEAPTSFRYVWMTLTVSMWIRGVTELFMLFVTKNWTPVIGISHDVLTFIAMVIAFFMGDTENFGTDYILMFFTASMFLSIIAETLHAYSFYRIMKGRTQGDDGLWYAHEDDPRFKQIILNTTIFNYILYAALISFYVKHLLITT